VASRHGLKSERIRTLALERVWPKDVYVSSSQSRLQVPGYRRYDAKLQRKDGSAAGPIGRRGNSIHALD
jgi:hypothetical protein